MRLYEFESKTLLKEKGLHIPKGVVVTRDQGILGRIDFDPPWYLKAQVPVGGRGKAGAIVHATSREEANERIPALFATKVNGYSVDSILVEEDVVAAREIYISVVMDRQQRSYSLLAGTMGGMDIEAVAKSNPETILKLGISPLRSIDDFDILDVSLHLNLPPEMLKAFISPLYSIALDFDAELVEINPLALTDAGLVALDAKITIDDNALFRQPRFMNLPLRAGVEEAEAAKIGLSYVSLEGNIGIIGNGAGLTMATMDLLKSEGGLPANFLDIGAGANSDKFNRAITFLADKDRVRVVLINIFGGLTRCDEAARGIVEAASHQKKPIVVRLAGTNEAEGMKILKQGNIPVFSNALETVKKAIETVGGAQ